jgi:hypothetical protein
LSKKEAKEIEDFLNKARDEINTEAGWEVLPHKAKVIFGSGELHWAMRLRKRLLWTGSHRWNAWVRDFTAWLEIHFPSDKMKENAEWLRKRGLL